LDGAIEAIKIALKSADEVSLVGFGAFSVDERAVRTGRNPRTGEAINTPAAKVPNFALVKV